MPRESGPPGRARLGAVEFLDKGVQVSADLVDRQEAVALAFRLCLLEQADEGGPLSSGGRVTLSMTLT